MYAHDIFFSPKVHDYRNPSFFLSNQIKLIHSRLIAYIFSQYAIEWSANVFFGYQRKCQRKSMTLKPFLMHFCMN